MTTTLEQRRRTKVYRWMADHIWRKEHLHHMRHNPDWRWGCCNFCGADTDEGCKLCVSGR